MRKIKNVLTRTKAVNGSKVRSHKPLPYIFLILLAICHLHPINMPPVRAPSRTQPTSVPVFALKWKSSTELHPSHILALAGGGGSAKTGIGNSIKVYIDYDKSSISIDTGEDIVVAIDVFATKREILLAAGVRDSIKIFYIPFGGIDDDVGEAAKEIANLEIANNQGINTVQWNSSGTAIVAGCENGKVCLISVQFHPQDVTQLDMRVDTTLEGHIKAICSASFHPTNPGVMISSAKDGTCRIWNMSQEGDDKCMKVLDCKIFDPKNSKPTPQMLNPKPGQCLVRGCAFGDLEGRIIYTVQSGRKGGAFLSVWKLLRKVIPNSDPNGPPSFLFEFQESDRRQVSDYPVSAMSLSGDMKTLSLGDTNGSITLLNTESLQKVKFWESAHDLPVTCIAARPLPSPLAGEELTGVSVDGISASADNKITFVTRQRKSSLKSIKDGKKIVKSHVFGLSYLFHLLVCVMVWYTSRVAYDVCKDSIDLKECVLKTVLWTAETSNRPGVGYLPH
jgi:WD40 repeat protein